MTRPTSTNDDMTPWWVILLSLVSSTLEGTTVEVSSSTETSGVAAGAILLSGVVAGFISLSGVVAGFAVTGETSGGAVVARDLSNTDSAPGRRWADAEEGKVIVT